MGGPGRGSSLGSETHPAKKKKIKKKKKKKKINDLKLIPNKLSLQKLLLDQNVSFLDTSYRP